MLSASAADALSFHEMATAVVAGLHPQAFDTLTLSETATAAIKRLAQPVSEVLSFVETPVAVCRRLNQYVTDTLSFGETTTYVYRNLNPCFADSLSFVEVASLTRASMLPTAADSASFAERVDLTRASTTPTVQDAIAFSETASGTTLPNLTVLGNAGETLSFVEQVAVTGPRVVSSQDVLGETVSQVDPDTGQVVDVNLGLVDLATSLLSVFRRWRIGLSFGELVLGSVLHPGAKEGVATDTLSFTDAACRTAAPMSLTTFCLRKPQWRM